MKDLVDTTEMYLRTIYELEEEGITPLRARIAERLEQSGPTVSQTVARMERDGLLCVADDRHLELTVEGRRRATRVMRKHRLAERLLADPDADPAARAEVTGYERGNLVLADEQPTAAQLGVAQKATRPRKPESLSRAQLRAGWAADPRGFGIDAEAQRQAREMRRAAAGVDVREVARQAVAGIHKAATFTRADLIEATGTR